MESIFLSFQITFTEELSSVRIKTSIKFTHNNLPSTFSSLTVLNRIPAYPTPPHNLSPAQFHPPFTRLQRPILKLSSNPSSTDSILPSQIPKSKSQNQ